MQCGKVYIRETQRALGMRIKEHQDACRLYLPENLWLQNMPGAMTIKLTGIQWRSWKLPQRRWSYW